MMKAKRWQRDATGRLVYDYGSRYTDRHKDERWNAFLTVQLWGDLALCPYCCKIMHYRQRKQGQKHHRWIELHHLNYRSEAVPFWRGVPACNQCHVPKLHKRGAWIQDRHNPDNNRNTFSASWRFRLQYFAAVFLTKYFIRLPIHVVRWIGLAR